MRFIILSITDWCNSGDKEAGGLPCSVGDRKSSETSLNIDVRRQIKYQWISTLITQTPNRLLRYLPVKTPEPVNCSRITCWWSGRCFELDYLTPWKPRPFPHSYSTNFSRCSCFGFDVPCFLKFAAHSKGRIFFSSQTSKKKSICVFHLANISHLCSQVKIKY